jgi:DNA-binding NtrC family response regulator
MGKKRPLVLAITDKRSVADILSFKLTGEYDITCTDGKIHDARALAAFTANCVLIDLEATSVNPLELLRELIQSRPLRPVIGIVTTKAKDAAQEVMSIGAYDILHLPDEMDRIPISVRNAIEKEGMERRLDDLRRNGDCQISKP